VRPTKYKAPTWRDKFDAIDSIDAFVTIVLCLLIVGVVFAMTTAISNHRRWATITDHATGRVYRGTQVSISSHGTVFFKTEEGADVRLTGFTAEFDP